jgi:putative heme-binding domain-containing protein
MKISPLPLLLLVAVLAAAPARAQNKGQLPERSDAEILQTVTLPEGYAATVFARPPQGGYPISISAAVDGTVFLAVDENGSLGRDRNLKPGETPDPKRRPGNPGKVIRMRDTDGDGKADEFKVFCEVESPRGVIWDAPSGTAPGTLYVMHPPNLTAYTDTDGDGVADKQEDILTGLGFDLDFRGADHTTNGCRLAIDGFIYIAMGDYGCVNARGKDGTTLTHRGGGIIRIRPDGTGLELVVEGTRNIYDVAVSPTLDLFTRDNTNDGGGWNDRLSFNPPGAHLGYPMLFKNFHEDMIDTLADFGGGSPCGSLWLDEPGLPKGLFTVEWGAGGIFYHDDLVPNGAGWKLTSAASDDPKPAYLRPPTPQKPWLKLTRPTDMDVDASGRIYITSWEGATFNYNGPNAGYVLRVVKKDKPKVEVPDLAQGKPGGLATHLVGPSATLRLAAQRELVRQCRTEEEFNKAIATISLIMNETGAKSPAAEAAAVFFQTQQRRATGHKDEWLGSRKFLVPADREVLIRAIGDNPDQVQAVAIRQEVVHALGNANPRIRAAAITALRRLGKTDAAPAILPLVADADPVVAHLAFRALRELKAVQPCLGALDSVLAGRVGVPPAAPGVSPEAIANGALRALYGIYEPAVVDGLIERLARLADAPGGTPTLPGSNPASLRRGLLNALCRLANQDAPYENPSVWWGTRPDTTGPVYQPIVWSETAKITSVLRRALEGLPEDDAQWLVARMYACKVPMPGLVELMLAKAGRDTPAKLTAIEGMIRNDNSLPPEAIAALQGVTGDAQQPPDLRARALRLFQRCAENGSVFPGAVAAFAPLAGHDLGDAKLTAVFEDFTRDGKNGKWVGDYAKALAGQDAPPRQLAAIVLVNLSTGRVGRDNEREAAKKAVEKGFEKNPESAAALLTAIARTGAKTLAERVKANLNDPNNAVAEAALFAFQKLGLKDAGAPAQTIGTMKYEDVFAAVQKGGDAKEGQQMFLRAGCIACHTLTPDEPPKGPILSAVAKIYDRAALTESILRPNARIAQGFESQWFKTRKGEQIEGFVTREGGDSLDVRNIAAQTVTLEKADLAERGKRETSMMPEGLLAPFTPAELANLLAYLESLKK